MSYPDPFSNGQRAYAFLFNDWHDALKHKILNYTLTSASTQITWGGSSPVDGEVLIVWVLQDASGGRAITWSASFQNGPTANLDTTANTTSVFVFAGRSTNNKWWLIQNLTGM